MIIPYDDLNFPARSAAYNSAASATATWNAGPIAVIVYTTSDGFVAVGENAVATTSSTPFVAFVEKIIKVPPGTGAAWRVSAIQNTASGTVFAKPCTQQLPTS